MHADAGLDSLMQSGASRRAATCDGGSSCSCASSAIFHLVSRCIFIHAMHRDLRLAAFLGIRARAGAEHPCP
jgi:hypothetical protein